MAKIGNLQVDTLTLAPSAITGTATGDPVGVPNPSGLPIEIYGRGVATYQGVSSGSEGTVAFTIYRSRDGAVMFTETLSFSGNNSHSVPINAAVLDTTASTSETYYISASATWSDPTAPIPIRTTVTKEALSCMYVKK